MRPVNLTGMVLMLVSFFASTVVSANHGELWPRNAHIVASIGFGLGDAKVSPNDDNTYFEGNGLGFGFGLGWEQQLFGPVSLVGRLDIYNSVDSASAISSADSSVGGMITAGFSVGNLHRPGQVYLTATTGFGFASLSDQGLDDEGDSVCSFCTGKEGISGSNRASRIAIGLVKSDNLRFEIVWMRAGGSVSRSRNEEVFLDTLQLQLVGGGNSR